MLRDEIPQQGQRGWDLSRIISSHLKSRRALKLNFCSWERPSFSAGSLLPKVIFEPFGVSFPPSPAFPKVTLSLSGSRFPPRSRDSLGNAEPALADRSLIAPSLRRGSIPIMGTLTRRHQSLNPKKPARNRRRWMGNKSQQEEKLLAASGPRKVVAEQTLKGKTQKIPFFFFFFGRTTNTRGQSRAFGCVPSLSPPPGRAGAPGLGQGRDVHGELGSGCMSWGCCGVTA